MKECIICGKKYQPVFKREYRPQVTCSEPCRRIHRRRYARDYMRQYRATQKERIIDQSKDAYGEYDEPFTENGKIDLEHQTWDFFPGIKYIDERGNTVTLPAIDLIGSIDERHLRIIQTDDGPRIYAWWQINHKGETKNGKKERRTQKERLR